jgi:hypothetical protein
MLVLALAFLGMAWAAPRATYRHHGNVLLPDSQVTPGAIRTTDAADSVVCGDGIHKRQSTKKYRHTTTAMKKAVCAAYGVKDCPKQNAMELDHLLPLEIGGKDEVGNLWVQPAPDYHFKDDLENKLRAMVCKTHELTLPEAQQCIMSDWAACYEKQIGPLPDELPKGTSGAK